MKKVYQIFTNNTILERNTKTQRYRNLIDSHNAYVRQVIKIQGTSVILLTEE